VFIQALWVTIPRFVARGATGSVVATADHGEGARVTSSTVTSTATVATARAARYGRQLTSHLGRRLATSWETRAGTGVVSFEHGRCGLHATDEALELLIELSPEADPTTVGAQLDRIEDVVGRHLVRFGARDELVARWVRSDGSAGSVQAGTGEDRIPVQDDAEADD
jgi:hypothetical protein